MALLSYVVGFILAWLPVQTGQAPAEDPQPTRLIAAAITDVLAGELKDARAKEDLAKIFLAAQKLDDKPGMAEARYWLGRAVAIDDSESALPIYRESLKWAREAKMPRLEIQVLVCIALAHAELDQGPDAARVYREAADLRAKRGEWALEGQLRTWAAEQLADDPEAAAKEHERAAASFAKASELGKQAAALEAASWTYQSIGKYEEAYATGERAWPLLIALGNRHAAATLLTWHGRRAFETYEEAGGDQWLRRSVAAYERAADLQRDEGDSQAQASTLLEAAKEQERAGEFTESTRLFRSALAAADQSKTLVLAKVLVSFGEAQYHQGLVSESRLNIERAIELLRAFRRDEEHEDDATYLLENALRSQALFIAEQGDHLSALALLRESQEVAPSRSYQALRLMAQIRLRAGDLAGAVEDAVAAVAVSRDHPNIAIGSGLILAQILQSNGELEKARSLLQDLMRQADQAMLEERIGLLGFTIVSLQQQYPDEAMKVAEQAVALGREEGPQVLAWAYRTRAGVWEAMQRHDEARQDFRSAVESARDAGGAEAVALAETDLAGHYIRRGEIEAGLQLYHEVLGFYRTSPRLRYDLFDGLAEAMDALAQAGRREETLRFSQELIELAARLGRRYQMQAWVHRAEALDALNAPKEAIQALAKARDYMAPADLAQIQYSLAIQYLNSGQAEAAVRELEQLVAQEGSGTPWYRAAMYLTLGDARRDLADLDGAREAYRRAQELMPKAAFAGAGQALVQLRLAALARLQGQPEEAARELSLALEGIRHSGKRYLLAQATAFRGVLLQEAGKAEEALAELRLSLELMSDAGAGIEAAVLLTEIGKIEASLVRAAEARASARQAEEWARRLGDATPVRVFTGLADLYGAIGDYARSAELAKEAKDRATKGIGASTSFSQIVPSLETQDQVVQLRGPELPGASASRASSLAPTASAGRIVRQNSKDYALLVAVDVRVDDQYGPLSNPVRDVEALGAVLKDIYGFEVIILRNPTVEDLRNELRKLLTMTPGPDDQLIVYFASHGDVDPLNQDGYVVLRKKGPEDTGNWYYFSALESAINGLPFQHVLLCLDTCFGGTFLDSHKRRVLGQPRAGLESLWANHLGDGGWRASAEGAMLAELAAQQRASRTEIIQRQFEVKPARYVLYSNVKHASDGRPNTNSPFAAALVDVLREPRWREERVLTLTALKDSLQQYTGFSADIWPFKDCSGNSDVVLLPQAPRR
jgi:tetratricopeptide (TPR) repeat protein